MQCWQCGVNVRPGQKLCVYCGATLTQEDEREYGAPDERSGSSSRDYAGGERDARRSSGGGGARGGRTANDDGWSAYDARPDRSGGRSRGGGEREQGADDVYRSGGKDAAGGRSEGRASSWRPGGMQLPSRGEESRSRDPLDDPRAPRSLRATPSAARPVDRSQGSYRGEVYDEAEYEYDDYNPRDRTSPRYQPRFDPDSAEYDAVADQRRKAQVRPRGYERDGGSAGGARGREAEAWGDARGGHDARDGRRYEEYDAGSRREDDYGRGGRHGAPADPRGGRYAPERGGAYSGYGEEESAEYPANYDDRGGRWGRGAGQARDNSERYGGMEQPGYGGGRDRRDNWGTGGYNAPLEDSWQQPAIGAANARNWGGGSTWAPGTDPNSWAPPGAGPGALKPAKTGRRGLVAAMAAVAMVGLLVVGFLGRSHILALLHRGGDTATSSPTGIATFTPGPTPTTLPGYKLYVSTRAHYAIEYPTAWTIRNDSSSSGGGYDYLDTFEQGSPVASVGVETAQGFNSASNDQIIQGEVEGAQQAKLTFTQIGGDVTVGVGGEGWTRRDYGVTASNGATLHMAILATHHAGQAYAIVLTAGTSDFARDDTGVFKTILSTFRFTS